jgi:hypothetical protein
MLYKIYGCVFLTVDNINVWKLPVLLIVVRNITLFMHFSLFSPFFHHLTHILLS